MKFGDKLRKMFGMSVITEDDWDDLADLLIEGDLGALFATQIVDELKETCKKKNIHNGKDARLQLKENLSVYAKKVEITPQIVDGKPNVIMLLGVNGAGKTTTSAKLGKYFMTKGYSKKVVLAAGDTFRAAAIEQLKTHAERVGIRVVAQKQGSDSGAVLYDAIESASADGSDLVIADTAGRMHNKQNLIKELEKMDKIVANKADPNRYVRLLVVDATTGQNALRQAEAFSEAVPINGIVITKYDSSAKGGVALAIEKQLGIPCAFICNGEKYEDISVFNPEAYLDEFLGLKE